jgi:hypothetical protein
MLNTQQQTVVVVVVVVVMVVVVVDLRAVQAQVPSLDKSSLNTQRADNAISAGTHSNFNAGRVSP